MRNSLATQPLVIDMLHHVALHRGAVVTGFQWRRTSLAGFRGPGARRAIRCAGARRWGSFDHRRPGGNEHLQHTGPRRRTATSRTFRSACAAMMPITQRLQNCLQKPLEGTDPDVHLTSRGT